MYSIFCCYAQTENSTRRAGYYGAMIIMLGGFVFTGRHVLARHLATLMSAHRLPVNDKKQRFRRVSRSGVLVEGVVQPRRDVDLESVYKKVLADLPFLVKMHDVIIVDDGFHREGPRTAFIQAARKLDDVVFVWIDAPDASVARRVPYLLSLRMVTSEEDAYARLAERKKRMQFSSPPLVFFHEISSRAAARRLMAFIELSVDRGFTAHTKRL